MVSASPLSVLTAPVSAVTICAARHSAHFCIPSFPPFLLVHSHLAPYRLNLSHCHAKVSGDHLLRHGKRKPDSICSMVQASSGLGTDAVIYPPISQMLSVRNQRIYAAHLDLRCRPFGNKISHLPSSTQPGGWAAKV